MILGIDKQAIREGLESVVNVPGRVEMLDTKTPYKVILDYSHSPDALENILTTVRTFTRQPADRAVRLRAATGITASGPSWARSPAVWQTSPSSPAIIPARRTPTPFWPPSRRASSLQAESMSSSRTGGKLSATRWKWGRDGDVIILAGKGHETYQDIMGVKRPFDEKVVVQELLRELQPELESSEE